MAIENKLGLTSSADLAREEERISKKKALVLFENGVFNKLEAGKFSALKAIHKYLFDEIFDFAGELRTVNISKGNFRFAPLMYLQATLANIDKMLQSTFDEIVEKYVEMNIAHPFREGNGRSARIWLDLIFKTELHKVVDWSKIDKEDAGRAIKTRFAPDSRTYFSTSPASMVFPSPTSSARTMPPVFNAWIAAQKALIWWGFNSIFASKRKWNGEASSSSFLYLLNCSSSRLPSI